jgi:hypothetical protein
MDARMSIVRLNAFASRAPACETLKYGETKRAHATKSTFERQSKTARM